MFRVEKEEVPVTIFANDYRDYPCAERVTRIELALSAWKAEDVWWNHASFPQDTAV